jgi:hypothetical protein
MSGCRVVNTLKKGPTPVIRKPETRNLKVRAARATVQKRATWDPKFLADGVVI